MSETSGYGEYRAQHCLNKTMAKVGVHMELGSCCSRKYELQKTVPCDDKKRCDTAEALAVYQSMSSLGEGRCSMRRTSAQRMSLWPADSGAVAQGNSLFITV